MTRIPILAAAISLLLAGVAVAAVVSIADRDDVSTALDISRATGAHNRTSDQVVHVVDTYEAIPVSDLATTPPSSICIVIWTAARPGEAVHNYEACATPDRRARRLVGTLSRERRTGPDMRVAAVRIDRPTARRVVFRIDPDHLRRPRSYRWRAETTVFGSGCRSASGCSDQAPNRPDVAETRLGRPRAR